MYQGRKEGDRRWCELYFANVFIALCQYGAHSAFFHYLQPKFAFEGLWSGRKVAFSARRLKKRAEKTTFSPLHLRTGKIHLHARKDILSVQVAQQPFFFRLHLFLSITSRLTLVMNSVSDMGICTYLMRYSAYSVPVVLRNGACFAIPQILRMRIVVLVWGHAYEFKHVTIVTNGDDRVFCMPCINESSYIIHS